MQISDLMSWFADPANFGTVVSAGTSLIALILGLIIGGLIVSSQSRKQQRTADEIAKSTVVGDVLDATIEVASWSALPPAQQVASDRAVARCDIHLRVLPVVGAGVIADWAGHQLAELKRVSGVGGGAAAQTTLDLFRDRLVLWIYNPKRAAKLCERDLERWTFVASPATSTAPAGRRSTATADPNAGFAPVPEMPPAFAPAQVAAAPVTAPGPAPVPAATSSIPAAAAAHAQAAAAQPKDPFEDLLGPSGRGA